MTGYTLVPIKPTSAMLDALRLGSRRDVPSDELCAVRYAAMLAAAAATNCTARDDVMSKSRAKRVAVMKGGE